MTDFAAYVFYVNRPDLFSRAIESFPDLVPELKVVDNSPNGSSFSGVEAFHPPVPLTYTQSMNWMMQDALSRGKDFIIHFHADAYSKNPTAVMELLDFVRKCRDEKRKWACAWTFYDILWAINPHAAKAVGGWDTVFSAYFSDNDMRRRWMLAGWECIDTHIQGMGHEGSATVNSDPDLRFLNGFTFPMYRHYYEQKWGDGPGKETYVIPFNRQD